MAAAVPHGGLGAVLAGAHAVPRRGGAARRAAGGLRCDRPDLLLGLMLPNDFALKNHCKLNCRIISTDDESYGQKGFSLHIGSSCASSATVHVFASFARDFHMSLDSPTVVNIVQVHNINRYCNIRYKFACVSLGSIGVCRARRR